jgi:acyl-CoA hydrolase
MPRDANHYGNVHGGIIMLSADNLAYTLASQYCRTNVVTASVKEVSFLAPVRVGDLVIMDAEICRVGNSSLDVNVRIRGERLKSGEIFEVADAKFVMVAVDEDGKPTRFDR